MKVALVTEYYYPYMGGISEHVHNLYLQLKLHGYEAKIVTPRMRFFTSKCLFGRSAPESDIIRTGESYPFYNNGGFVSVSSPFGLAKRLRAIFERERFDIVHVHSPLVPILPLLAVRDAPCPVVGTIHTIFKHAVGYFVFRRQVQELVERMRLKIAVAPICAELMSRYFPMTCKVIPNGIDTTMFQPGIPPVEAFPKKGKTKRILFLGRFDPHNGLDILLRAFARVHARDRSCELIVVGDGPLARRYKRMARPFSGSVHFVGPQHLLRPNYYQAADVFCNPATLHATSIVNLEAMASGLPVVASEIPAFQWLMREGGAVFFPRGDDKSLAERLIDLLEDPASRRHLGGQARRIALEYSWERIGPRIIQEYRRLLGIPAAEEVVLDEGPVVRGEADVEMGVGDGGQSDR